MQKLEVLKNEKYNVGKIQKQRINIVSKTKGKALKQKDIKEIVKKINAKYIRDKETEPKILVRGMSPLGVWTIKSYEDSIDEMWEDDEDYFDTYKEEFEMDEEEIISFLNEYYLIYPKRLPGTQLY
jgi:hypothetical protein